MLQYRDLAERSWSADLPLSEIYPILRARVVLGLPCDLANIADPVRTLLSAQIAAYARRDLELHFAKLVELQPAVAALAEAPIMLAELQFTLGFLCAQSARYQQAILFQKKAAALYREAGLCGQEGLTLFNLAVNHRHLAQSADATAAIGTLETLSANTGIPMLALLLHRFRGYEYLHREDYEQATSEFAEAQRLALELGRRQDAAYQAVHRLHCLLSLGRLDEAQSALAEARTVSSGGALESAFDEFEFLLAHGMLSSDEASELLARLEDPTMDPVSRVLLAECALSRLARAEEWETLLKLARRAQDASTRLEQSPGLVDFRRFQIEALLALGRKQEAERIARAYESAARATGAEPRLQWLTRCLRSNESALEAPAPTEIVLDRSQALILVRSLERGESRISAARNPSLNRLLLALAQHPVEGLGTAELFSKVFESPFHPHLHEARLASLLHRARRALGSDSSVLRTDGRVMLHPSTSLRLEGSCRHRARDSRRNLVLQALKRIRKPRVTLSDLETETRIPRRTLQEDLRQLADSGRILRTGDRRGATYRLGERA